MQQVTIRTIATAILIGLMSLLPPSIALAGEAESSGDARLLQEILAILKGHLEIHHEDQVLEMVPGQFCLLPASLDRVRLNAVKPTEFLHIEPGSGT